jgi:hypothetical protein
MLVLVVVLVLACSGWVYYIIQSRIDSANNELNAVQSAFVQQYGEDAVVKKLVSPNKVYAAVWTGGSDNITHVSWNIGGLWVTVYSSGNITTGRPGRVVTVRR